MKAYGRMEMKICINELGHKAKMAAMPRCGKKTYKMSRSYSQTIALKLSM